MSLTSSLRSLLTPAIQTSRVNQLDAELIDNELEHLLTEPFYTALAPICGTNWRPELMTILKVIILRFSLQQSFSYGAQLENLRWIDGKSKKSLSRSQVTTYSLLAVLPQYFRTRVRDHMLSSGWADYPASPNWRSLLIIDSENQTRRNKYWKRAAWNLSESLEQLYGGVDLINFLLFLFNGHYRSVLERILGIRFVYRRLDLRRNVSFEFLNRQLVWESITDFVLLILPLINFNRIRLRLSDLKTRLMNWLRQATSDSVPDQKGSSIGSPKSRNQPNEARFRKLSNDVCPICVAQRVYRSKSGFNANVMDPHDPMTFSSSISANNSNPSNPSQDDRVKLAYQVDCCKGLYCYYCLVAEMMRWRESNLDQRWICWRCGNETTSIQRWNGG